MNEEHDGGHVSGKTVMHGWDPVARSFALDFYNLERLQSRLIGELSVPQVEEFMEPSICTVLSTR
jgi:hypothetical protein